MFFKPKTHAAAIAPLAGIVANLRRVCDAKLDEHVDHIEAAQESQEKAAIALAEHHKAGEAATKIAALFS